MRHAYPALIRPDDNVFSVFFPDIGRGGTAGDDLPDALCMAADWLAGTLVRMEDKKEAIPPPTPPCGIETRPGDVVTLVYADTDAYRKSISREPARVVVELPRLYVTIADADGVDLSRTLRDALKAKLGLHEGEGDGNDG